MPSGAKKRKAAKKKKETQSNNPSAPTHPHGDEDVKHHYDRESDVGENSSPKSQGHQNLLTEGEEEEIEKERKLPNLPSAEELRIDRGEKHIRVEESVIPVERECKIEDELDKKHASVERDEVARKYYDGGSSRSSSSSNSSDDESQGREDESYIASVDSEKITVLSEQVEVDEHSPADISVASYYVVESAFREKGEEKLSSVDDKISASVAFVDAALERKEEAIVQSDANTGTTSDPKECVTQENDDGTALPYNNAPRASADNGAEHVKDSVVSQPVLAPPFPVEKTSWKSCCGLFEVFSRSSA